MWKRYELVLGVLLASIFWAGVLAWQSSLPAPNQPTNNPGESHPTEKAKHGSAEEEIALYTLWLAILTGALVAVSAFQILFLTRADRTARLTAEASKKTADSMVGVERPILVIEKMATTIHASGASIDYAIENIGRTPAIIEETAATLVWTENLPPEPDYGEPRSWRGIVLHSRSKIPDDDSGLIETYSHGDDVIWENRLTRHPLIFFGYFVYTDVFGTRHQTGFGYSIDAGRYGAVRRIGGAAYNYDRTT